MSRLRMPWRAGAVARALLSLAVWTVPLVVGVAPAGAVTAPPSLRPAVHPLLDFEINQGQADQRVRFLSRGAGYAFYLTADGAVMRLAPPRPDAPERHAGVVTMRWLGASSRSVVEGLQPLEAKSHYLIGRDPTRWRTNVAHFAKVRYRGLYPGVDLVYYGDPRDGQQQIEYDLVVAPGADPGAIRLEVDGVDSASVDARGDLRLTTGGGTLTQRRPVIYQEIGGVRRPVAGAYAVRASAQGRHEIGFTVAAYDTGRPLVIDPVLVLSTYWGGSLDDEARAVAVDINTGDICFAGSTGSIDDFPTINPVGSAFVNDPTPPPHQATTYAFLTCLNQHGTAVIYSTYIGGSATDTADPAATAATSLDVDGAGSAYVTGWTNTNDLPVCPNATDCPSPAGTTGPPAYQAGYGGGASDAFVVKIKSNGSELVYATYLGGTGADRGNGIRLNGSLACVVGTTTSDNFPTQVPWQSTYGGGSSDVFIAKLDDDGTALSFSTYFGGAGTDDGLALSVGTDATITLTGSTNSGSDFPILNPVMETTPFYDGSQYGGGASDVFVSKFSFDGRTLLYSTYLGGDGDEVGRAVTTDSAARAYVTGETTSATTYPTTSDALQPANATSDGKSDAFVSEVDSSGQELIESTYLGGTEDDAGHGIARSPEGFVYVTGKTASAGSFPQVNPVQPAYGGGPFDAFVTRLNPSSWSLDYSTFWGGSGDDEGLGIVVDIGTAHIVGATTSGNLQTKSPIMLAGPPAYDGGVYGGGIDAFLLSLEDDQASGCDMGWRGGPWRPFGRVDPGLPAIMGAAALWWMRRRRRLFNVGARANSPQANSPMPPRP